MVTRRCALFDPWSILSQYMDIEEVIKWRREKDKATLDKLKRRQEERELSLIKTLIDADERQVRLASSKNRRPLLKSMKPLKDDIPERAGMEDLPKMEPYHHSATVRLSPDVPPTNILRQQLSNIPTETSTFNTDESSLEDHLPSLHGNIVQPAMETSAPIVSQHSPLQMHPPALIFTFSPPKHTTQHPDHTTRKKVKLINPTHDQSMLVQLSDLQIDGVFDDPHLVQELGTCLRFLPGTTSKPKEVHSNHSSSLASIPPGGCVSISIEFTPNWAFHRHINLFGTKRINLSAKLDVIPLSTARGKRAPISKRRHQLAVLGLQLIPESPIIEPTVEAPGSVEKNEVDRCWRWVCAQPHVEEGNSWVSTLSPTKIERVMRLVNRGQVGSWIHVGECQERPKSGTKSPTIIG